MLMTHKSDLRMRAARAELLLQVEQRAAGLASVTRRIVRGLKELSQLAAMTP